MLWSSVSLLYFPEGAVAWCNVAVVGAIAMDDVVVGDASVSTVALGAVAVRSAAVFILPCA